MLKICSAGVVLLALGACGGGSSEAPLSVSLSAPTQTIQLAEGASGQLSFDVNVAGAGSKSLIPVVKFDQKLFALNTPISSSGGKHSVTLKVLPDIVYDGLQGQLTVQLCEDAACVTPRAGTTQTLSYKVAMELKDWGMYQRNATHRGYVPLLADVSRFKQAWTWWLPQLGALNSVASGDGKVFLTSDNYNMANGAYALDEATGTALWSKTASNLALNAPAYANGAVYANAREVNNSMYSYSLWTLNAKDGGLTRKIPLTRGDDVLAPTIEGDSLFIDGAYFSGGVTSFSLGDGATRWRMSDGNNAFSTPAVDQEQVYYYNGSALFVYRRADGSRVASIRDTNATNNANSSDAISAPVLGSSNNVLVLSGTQFTGLGGSSAAGGSSRQIVNFGLGGANIGPLWITADRYLTQPALVDGVIYAGTGSIYTGATTGYTARFDAISESTGKVLWSWTPPATDKSFYRNVVVTKNLAFVSTDQNVYAIDLAMHQSVWQAPYPGELAISAGKFLMIATGARLGDGRVVAIKLQ
jgi:hypothetical protein